MKKIVFAVLGFLGAGIVANAQRASLGPNAGFGASWISNYQNSEYMPAGNVGLSFVYSAIGHFGVGADLKYSIEGGKMQNNNIETTSRLDYVRVPVKLIYFFGDYGQKLRPKVALGPSFGFLVGGHHEVRNLTNNQMLVDHHATDHWDTFDVGLHGAAGLNYRLVKNTWFNAELAYYHGLKNNLRSAVNDQNFSNRNLGLNIGVNFGL